MAELESLETAAEHERILREIESTDTACIGPTLRSVYDGEEHGRFMEKLEARIRNHDREIEKLCNFHYQGFVDSITELLKVRAEAQKLKNQVTDTNRKLQQNEGKELLVALEELRQCRLQQRNISATVDKLTLCLPVLEMYSKLREQMKSKRHYPALKTLEHLEQTFLPQVSHYRFCQAMVRSMADLKDFLESIRKHSERIGETPSKRKVEREGKKREKGKEREGKRKREGEEREKGKEREGEEREKGKEKEGKERKERKGKEREGKRKRKRKERKERKERKDLGYGFPVNQLFEMLLEIQDQYSETLLKKWAGVFRNILDSDNYSPIPVSNEEVYKKIVGQFPFQDAELEKQPFPKKFPFSEFVPRVFGQIQEFIHACLKFSEDLHLSSTEVDDMIRKSTNLLLTRTLSNCLQNVIKRKNVGLTELVQIIINTTHLEKSCRFLEEFITNITNVLPDTVHTTKLYGTTTFKDARHAAEEEIYTNLNQKIDQFLQLADYDWLAPEPGSRASDYLVDLIGFLRSTFAVFTHLPGKVAQTACMSACKHLSTSLLQLLLEAEVRQLTLGALQQFNLDVEECEQFARSGPVPGFQGDTLQLAFIDLRQLLDLFIQWDWSTYLADYGQPTCKYLRVNPTTALVLLEKMRDTSRKNNVFAQFRKNERDKQKLIDTVAKQLRGLINSHHS
uniref:Exocyst complex component n=1 Tax=Catharus ustulatus TaxID=91951 RepID=A0A8C3Y975_CATUS